MKEINPEQFKKVIVHAGEPHDDDLYAAAIAVNIFNIEKIERKNPTSEELEDPSILVLDVGGKHEPEKGNFDHHSTEFKGKEECALSLFLKDLGLHETFMLFPWYRNLSILDNCGPVVLCKKVGLPKENLVGMLSPINAFYKKVFKTITSETKYPTNACWCDNCYSEVTPIFEMLLGLGSYLLTQAKDLQKRLEILPEKIKVIEIKGLVGIINHVARELTPNFAVNEYCEKNNIQPAFSISYDERGEGWSLFRYNDHPRINFLAVKGNENVTFVHPGGFTAKTKNIFSKEAVSLVEASIS